MGAKIDFKEIENISHDIPREYICFFIIINIGMFIVLSLTALIYLLYFIYPF